MNQPVSHPELLFWRRLALLLVLVAAAALTIELWPVIAPFLAAFLLAYLLNPVIGQMTRMGLSRQVAILLVLLGGLVVLVVGFVLLLPPLVQQVLYVQDNWPAMVSWVNSTLIPWLEAHLGLEVPLLNGVELKNYLMNFASEKSSAEQAGSALAWVARSGLSLANFLGLVVLVPIITLYLLWDFNALGRRFKNLVPLRYRAKVLDLFVECHAALGAFVRGQLAVMTALGLIYALGLELVGLDLGLLVGLISGLASIVPYVGFAVGLTISITMGLVQNGLDMSFLLSILAVYMVGQVMEGYVLQPKLLGTSIGLSPVLVIFAVLAGASLMGFAGMVLSLPVAAVLMVLARRARQHYLASDWYSGPSEHASQASDAEQTPPWLSRLEEEQ